MVVIVDVVVIKEDVVVDVDIVPLVFDAVAGLNVAVVVIVDVADILTDVLTARVFLNRNNSSIRCCWASTFGKPSKR